MKKYIIKVILKGFGMDYTDTYAIETDASQKELDDLGYQLARDNIDDYFDGDAYSECPDDELADRLEQCINYSIEEYNEDIHDEWEDYKLIDL